MEKGDSSIEERSKTWNKRTNCRPRSHFPTQFDTTGNSAMTTNTNINKITSPLPIIDTRIENLTQRVL